MDPHLSSTATPFENTLAGAFSRATAQVTGRPDARRAMHERVRSRRRRRLAARAGAAAAVVSVLAGAAVLRRAPDLVTLGEDPRTAGTVHRPGPESSVPRLTATELPDGYRFTRLPDSPSSSKFMTWAKHVTLEMRRDQPGPPEPLRRQVFRSSDPARSAEGVILRIREPADIERLTGARDISVGGRPGQVLAIGRSLTMVVEDAGRSVIADAFGMDEATLVRFAAGLRWDSSADRYVVDAGGSDLIETFHDQLPADTSYTFSRGRACRSGSTFGCFDIEVWHDDDGYDAETVPIVQATADQRVIDVRGSTGFVVADGQQLMLRWVTGSGDAVIVSATDPAVLAAENLPVDPAVTEESLIKVARGLSLVDESTWQSVPEAGR